MFNWLLKLNIFLVLKRRKIKKKKNITGMVLKNQIFLKCERFLPVYFF